MFNCSVCMCVCAYINRLVCKYKKTCEFSYYEKKTVSPRMNFVAAQIKL